MTDPVDIPLDRQTYNMIVATATNVKNLTKAVGEIKTDVAALKEGVSDIKKDVAVCLNQDKDIVDLKNDVEELQKSTSFITGKLAGIAIVIAFIANWITPILSSFFGGKS